MKQADGWLRLYDAQQQAALNAGVCPKISAVTGHLTKACGERPELGSIWCINHVGMPHVLQGRLVTA